MLFRSGLKSFLLQRLFHIHALFFQALRREHEIADDCFCKNAHGKGQMIGEHKQKCRDPGRYQHDDQRRHTACRPLSRFRLREECPRLFFCKSDQPTDQADRMIHAVRISQQKIQHKSNCHSEQRSHPVMHIYCHSKCD